MMKRYLKIIILFTMENQIGGTVDGVSYMDPLSVRTLKNKIPPGEDPCNPLYWYPRNIPEYCNYAVTTKPDIKPPFPMPLPIPFIPPPPIPGPPVLAPAVPTSYPLYPIPRLPYGIPIAPTNPIIPVIANPYIPSLYPAPQIPSYSGFPQAAMVPGLPGMVSQDGGINILPFSDVYSDLLEKHENRRRMRKYARILSEHEDFLNRNSNRRWKKSRKFY